MGTHDEEFASKEEREGYWISRRRPDRTYVSKSFEHNRPNSADNQQPSRFVYKVFDPDHETELHADASSWTVRQSPGGRVQIKLLVVRSAGHVKHLLVHRLKKGSAAAEVLLDLEGEDARKLIALLGNSPLSHLRVVTPSGSTMR